MKTIALSLAILAVSAGGAMLSAPASAAFEIQMLMSRHNQAQNAARIDKAFGLAAKERGRQEIEISCAPADSQWCAKDFVAACDKNKGGMSTNPDGGVTCSLPQHQ